MSSRVMIPTSFFSRITGTRATPSRIIRAAAASTSISSVAVITRCVITFFTGISPIFLSACFVFSQLINSRIGISIISIGEGSQRSSDTLSDLSRAIRSDSVIIPTSSFPSRTGSPPIWCSLSRAVASRSGVSGEQVTGFFVIASFTSMFLT